MLGATQPSAPSRRGARSVFARSDRIAIALFVLVPICIYVPYSLAGYPVIPGDDLVQNEPLRVLAGELIRSGRLPAWDPLIWSGTPLLAGWNAGAMFPGTWLFAVLGGVTAWTINYTAVPIISAIGCYVFFRRRRITALPSALGALLFTYTGFMDGQVVHLGLSEGTALTPWLLVGIDLLLPSANRARVLSGIALGGAAAGLIILAGDPRAISSAIAIVAIDLVALLWKSKGERLRLLAAAAATGILGGAIGAVQWLPGLAFLRSSQRSGLSYDFYASGSLGVRTILRGLIVPFLTGANGNLGLPVYQGSYNLPELTIGSGLVALVASIAYLPKLLERLRYWTGGRTPPEDDRAFGTIYVLILVGVLLTLGSYTPLGHLLVHIPLFGGERLQNRNAVLFDFALAWITAYFVEDLAAPLRATADHLRSQRSRWTLALCCLVPSVATIAVVLAGLIRPAAVESFLEYQTATPSVIGRMWPYLAATLLIAAALGVFVIVARRLSPRTLRIGLATLVVADVLVYALNAPMGATPSSVLAKSTMSSRQLAELTGANGRFALYNPAYGQGGSDPNTLPELGVTDLNVLHGVASVQGYGSIVNGKYQSFTGTHLFQALNTAALGSESFNTLDLTALVSLPPYFSEEIPDAAGIPIAMPADKTHSSSWTETGPGIASPLPYSAGPWGLSATKPRSFTLATPTQLALVTILLDHDGPTYPRTLRITLLHNDQVLESTLGKLVRDHLTVSVRTRSAANFIEVADPNVTPAIIGGVIATTSAPTERLLLDGALEGVLSPTHWSFKASIGQLVVFHNLETLGLAWLQSASSKTPNTSAVVGSPVQVLSNTPVDPQVLEVDTPVPVELVRAEAYAPGWTARLTPVGGGKSVTYGVHRFGLVQAISIPPGQYRVSFSYAPITLLTGFAFSAFGVAVLALVCAVLLIGARRRRRAAGSPPSTEALDT